MLNIFVTAFYQVDKNTAVKLPPPAELGCSFVQFLDIETRGAAELFTKHPEQYDGYVADLKEHILERANVARDAGDRQVNDAALVSYIAFLWLFGAIPNDEFNGFQVTVLHSDQSGNKVARTYLPEPDKFQSKYTKRALLAVANYNDALVESAYA